MKHTFLWRAVSAMLSVSFLGLVTPAVAQTTPSSQASSPAANASSAVMEPAQKTVDFLFNQIVKIENTRGMGLGSLAFNFQDADVMAKVWSRANFGNAHAQYVLAMCYSHGWGGLPENDSQAAFWYRKAVDQGLADAQSNLGELYDNGWGVPENSTESAFWYRKAANQGNGWAQNSLGTLYLIGLGVPRDYNMAAYWYRKAADQGYGITNLGELYENGQGVPKNYIVAYALYNIDAINGNQRAVDKRDRLAQNMSNEELNDGQNLSLDMKQNKDIGAVINSFIALENYRRIESGFIHKKTANGTSAINSNTDNNLWPQRPAKQPGVTTCNTRCINGSCWRTYDNGRHARFTVPPSVDPFSGEITFKQPPC